MTLPRYVGSLGTQPKVSILKQAALLFDELIVADLPRGCEILVDIGLVPENYADVADAAEAAVARVAPDVLVRIREQVRPWEVVKKDIDRQLDQLETIADPLRRQAIIARARQVQDQGDDLLARAQAEVIAYVRPYEVVVPLLTAQMPDLQNSAGRAAVTRLVLNSMPYPSESTPWEAIKDWRADEQAREQYAQIRAWIGRMTRAQLSSLDVTEELGAALASYERYMAIQHKKFRRGRIEAVLIPVAEAVEDLASFQLSSALSKLFGIFREEVSLLESELNAPGREVAYIAAARSRFD